MTEPLKVLSLFAGIGGFDLGLERTGGFKTVAFCEIEPFCRRVLAKHWPDVPCYDDVRTLTGERLAADGIAVDAICGGFPCQDISAGGHGAGLKGERSGLFYEIVRLAGEIRPPLIVLENSAVLLSRGLGDVLGALAALGYDAEWHCIPASHVGAGHIRDRIWIIGHAHEEPARIGSDDGLGRLGIAKEVAEGRERELGRREAEPSMGGVVHALPNRLDRVGALGNAVVPQIPELIGRAILQARIAA